MFTMDILSFHSKRLAKGYYHFLKFLHKRGKYIKEFLIYSEILFFSEKFPNFDNRTFPNLAKTKVQKIPSNAGPYQKPFKVK
jgi:hypothetical protein